VSGPDTVPAAPWSDWTAQRPAFAGTHLDTAAAGRMSREVQRAITDHLHRESEIGAYVAEADAAATIATGRAHLGALLVVPAEGVAFVESATAALHSLLTAWPLTAHATVAVAPSEWGPILRVFGLHGVEVRQLPVDDVGQVDIVALRGELATRPPSVVHVSHVAAHRALIQPVEEIVGACRAAGVPVWVDAAQALGHVEAASGPDAVIATSRKWLCGPRGVGVLGVAEQWWPRLRVKPLVLAPDRPVVGRLESDEANVAGRVGLCTAVQEHLARGAADVQHRLAEIGSRARAVLAELPGWRVVPRQSGAIVALQPSAGQDVFAERQRILRDHHILVTASQPARAPLEMTSPWLRVSPHVDLADEQLDDLARALAGGGGARATGGTQSACAPL
jgi:pyridoxal 5-phosphate dependent beta-lyase